MKILLINHYAGSLAHGMEYRPYYFAREWIRQGHTVQVVAATQSHVRTVQPRTAGTMTRETVDGVDYLWVSTPSYEGNGIGRVANLAAFCARLALGARQLARDFQPDVVVASSTYPMDIWLARRIAGIARAKLVYEVHDLWPASLIEISGMSKWHPFALMCQKAENDAYRDSDVVISMLPKVSSHMESHGLDLRKLHIVPNGISPEEWQADSMPLEPELTAALMALRAGGRLIVGYAGSHGLPNALDVLFDAAALLRNQPVNFVLVGNGHEKARLERRVRDEGLDNVLMLPAIPKAQIPALLRTFDIAYIGWRRVSLYRFGIAPNKLMDYMMAGRAVLHSVEAGNDPVADAGCGLTVAPESAEAVAAGILQLAALSTQERDAMGARGKAYVMANHSYEILARRFVEAVQSR